MAQRKAPPTRRVDVGELLVTLDRMADYGLAVYGRRLHPLAAPAAEALRRGEPATVLAVDIERALERAGHVQQARELFAFEPGHVFNVSPTGEYAAR